MDMVTTYSDFRINLKKYLDTVYESKKELRLTRPNHKDVVIVDAVEYESMVETFHLLKSPKNAERLYLSLQHAKEGNILKKDLTGE